MELRDMVAMLVLAQGSINSPALAQGFVHRYDPLGQGGAQVAWDIEVTINGNYIVLGTTTALISDSIYYDPVLFTLLLNADGSIIGADSLVYQQHAVYPGFANCACPTHDGGFASGGGTYAQDATQRCALYRIDSVGRLLSLQEFGVQGQEWIGRQVKQTTDRGFLLCGETSSIGAIDAFLIRTDSLGVEQWRRTYGGPDFWDFAAAVDTSTDDGYFVGGQSQDSPTNKQLWVLRLNELGDTLWTKKWGTQFDEPNAHLTTLANGDPIIASAWGFAPAFALTQAYMAELDQDDGSFVWQRWYGPIVNLTTLFTAKEVHPGAGCISAGFTFEPNTNFFKGVMLRTAANGDSLWMRNYFYYDSLMTDGMGEFKDVIPTQDGGFIACGYTNGAYTGPYPANYSQDVWVVKVDSLGCIVPGCDVPMGITSQITNMGYALTLYPNPVRDQLHVSIKLPSSFRSEGPLVLTVVSADGRMVRQQQVPTSAPDEFVIDVQALAAGGYTLHLSDAHTWIAGKKFIIE